MDKKDSSYTTCSLEINYKFFEENGLPGDLGFIYIPAKGDIKVDSIIGLHRGHEVYRKVIKRNELQEDRKEEAKIQKAILRECLNQIISFTESPKDSFDKIYVKKPKVSDGDTTEYRA